MNACNKCGGSRFRQSGGCADCAGERRRKWRHKNAEHVRAQRRKWYWSNAEAIKKRMREAYRSHLHVKQAERYASNPDKYKAASKAWAKANAEHGRNKRARRRKGIGKISKGLGQKLFQLQRGKCPCCNMPLGNNYHLDHKIPLASGGPNEDWNIQLMRPECNMQKAKKDPIAFMRLRGYLL